MIVPSTTGRRSMKELNNTGDTTNRQVGAKHWPMGSTNFSIRFPRAKNLWRQAMPGPGAIMTLAKLIMEAKTCHFALLHYDSASESMIEWCWPADREGRKILPSNLEKHCKKYDFRYPCCVCANGGGRGAYIEVAVYPWWNKTTNNTFWIVRCASDRCGYQVKIDMYSRLAPLAAFWYPRREQRAPPIQLEWTFREQMELLNELDSPVGDRIGAREFRVLFKRCKKCMQVGARPVMNHHICSGGVQKQQRR
ncbi:uncharacterized protein HD556DRAFT_1303094 [Suillus plorans]|uniref:Uncharacterized protein n=1 Tax=Suillus plorans TaxID=116603 RepID=A0A9P7DYY1_9AGAM|nr:uncharacterized protein HD556DRAFT_1303094 [Suillus plorans]KAG1806685.1 hypothetical protein HD556DRAFT_1303094 [Suillus plorans]